MRLVYFTTWKCASSFLPRLCADIAAEAGLAHYSPNQAPGAILIDEHFFSVAKFWQDDNTIIGPVRDPRMPPRRFEYDKVRAVIHLRDPRDLLVSLWFHALYSKIPPNPEAKRQEWLTNGIDAFVMQRAPRFVKIFDLYLRLSTDSAIPIVTYEELVTDTDRYMRRMADHLGLSRGFADMMTARHAPAFAARAEDKAAHVRKVTPGDHRDKLAPATIEQLNSAFRPYLERVGLLEGAA